MDKINQIRLWIQKFFEMKILTSYVLKQLLLGVFVVTTVLAAIAWLTQILKLLKYVLERGLSFSSFMVFTSLLLPQIINLVLPIAFFAILIFMYNKLIQDREFVVMTASGASRYTLAKPVLICMTILTIFSYFSTLYLEPVSAVKFKNFQWNIRNDLSNLVIQEDKFTQIQENLTIYVERSSDNALYNIIIFDNRNKKHQLAVFARKGMLVQTNNGLTIALTMGSIQEKSQEGKYTFGYFEEYSVNLGLMEQQLSRKVNPKELGLIENFTHKEADGNKKKEASFRIEAHKRLLSPLFHVIFAFIALIGIFASSLTGRGKNKTLLIAVSVFVAMEALLIFSFNFFETNIRYIWALYLMYFVIISILVFTFFFDNSKAKPIKEKKK